VSVRHEILKINWLWAGRFGLPAVSFTKLNFTISMVAP